MTQKETQLFAQEYDVGEPVIFALYRQQQEERVTVSLKYRFPSQGPEEITCRKIFYPLRAEDYESPYLSWYNLICCSNNYGPVPVVPYMNRAVQKGRKVAATIYPASAQEYMSILAEVEQKPDRYYCYPYHPQEYRYLLYLSRTGTLRDYFDLDRLLQIYSDCGIALDRGQMEEYFSRELNWFGREECPIPIHFCTGSEEFATVGLLFGYPVASTVALIARTRDLCEENRQERTEEISKS